MLYFKQNHTPHNHINDNYTGFICTCIRIRVGVVTWYTGAPTWY